MKQLYILLLLSGLVANAGAQNLQTVNPNSGTIGAQALQLVISGSGLDFNQGTSTQVVFTSQNSGFEFYGYYFASAGTGNVLATVDIPYMADAGLYDLNIKDNLNHLSLDNAFTVLPQLQATPTLNITPNSGDENNSVEITAHGHLTHFTANVSFFIQLPGQGQFMQGQSINVTNDSLATVLFNFFFSGLSPGIYNFIAVDSRDNQVLSTNQFTLNGSLPQVAGAAPDSGAANSTLEVTISGLNTNFTSATSTQQKLWIDNHGFIIYPNTVLVPDDNSLTGQFTIPANAPDGYYDVYTFDFFDGALKQPRGFFVYNGVNGISSVNEVITNLQVFPNPASNYATASIEMAQSQWVDLSVVNIAGEMVMNRRVYLQSGKSSYNLDITALSSGNYLLNLNVTGQQLSKPFVVTH